MWDKTRILAVCSRRAVIIPASSAVTGSLCAVAAALWTKRKLTLEFEARLEREVQSVKETYKSVAKTDEWSSPEALAESKGVVVEKPEEWHLENDTPLTPERLQAMIESGKDAKAEEVVVSNIFDTARSIDLDYEAEAKLRTGDRPYVISYTEFENDSEDLDQDILTYFRIGGVLVDEQDMPIPDPDALVGLDNLQRFGDGSGEEKVVYIRNDAFGSVFRVELSESSFEETVMGDVDDDNHLAHTEPMRRKMRWDD